MTSRLVKGGTKMESIPYRSILGSIMYLMVGTRPDIAFAVSELSKCMESPTEDHCIAIKRVLRYLKGSAKYSMGNYLLLQLHSLMQIMPVMKKPGDQ